VLDGRLNTRSYNDKEGARRTYTEVVALEMAVMDRRSADSEAEPDATETSMS
jgi:single-stranded DNA-binding protein